MTAAGIALTADPRPVVVSPSPCPHARRIASLCGAIALITVIGTVGDVLSPVLLARWPALLVLLTPRTVYLVAVAHEVPFPLFMLVAVVRLCAADPLHFMLGRAAGPAATSTARRLASRLGRRRPRPRAGQMRTRLRLPAPSSPLWLLAVAASPTAKTMLVAGGAGLRRRGVAVANVGGTVARVLAIWLAGRAFPTAGEAVASVAPWIAVPGCVGVVGLAAARWRRAGLQPAFSGPRA